MVGSFTRLQCFQTGKVAFLAVKFVSNPQVMKNFSANLSENSNGIVCLNLSGFFIKEFSRATLYVRVNRKNSQKSPDYDEEVISTSIDTCKAGKGVMGNFIAKILLEQMREKSNYNFSCVTKPGPFYVNNFAPPQVSLLPTLVTIRPEVFWEFSILAKAKVKSTKTLAHFYTVRLEGKTTREF